MKQLFFSLLKVRVSVGILPFQIHTLTLRVARPGSSSPAASPTLGHVPRGGTFPLGGGACKSSRKQPGGGARLAVLSRAAGLLPPAEWGSAEPAGVSAVSSSAGLIPRHSIEAPVITKARPVAHVG